MEYDSHFFITIYIISEYNVIFHPYTNMFSARIEVFQGTFKKCSHNMIKLIGIWQVVIGIWQVVMEYNKLLIKLEQVYSQDDASV